MSNDSIKILVILGPTASGKSDLAVKLAEKFNGEVISADSRQVYRGLDIGTGKITLSEMRGIRHHCLDIADPTKRFTVEEWRECARKAIADVHSRGKLPIVCGGTGFYLSALIDGTSFPPVPPNDELRAELGKKPLSELLDILGSVDPSRLETIEKQNPRRIIRAIEIATALELEGVNENRRHQAYREDQSSKQPDPVVANKTPPDRNYSILSLGIKLPDSELKARIRARLVSRVNSGMIEEAERLHAGGLSFERMDELGLEYRYLARYIQGKMNKEEMIDILATRIWQYARRQKTWWRKDERIRWFDRNDLTCIYDVCYAWINQREREST